MNRILSHTLRLVFVSWATLAIAATAWAQPRATSDGVRFTLAGKDARTVSVVGDFNGWSKQETPLQRDSAGVWSVVRGMEPGIYQYKFVVNGSEYLNDPGNPVTVENYDKSSRNSVFVLTRNGTVELTATPPSPPENREDRYPAAPGRKTVYLNIIWHQHQPLYVNPETDQLTGPWVRTHATKDYYDMAAMLRKYPDVHCNINLTSSLLVQLLQYYVDRLGPFVDTKTNEMDVGGFLAVWKGKTDPWIDLMLKNTAEFDSTDIDYLYRNTWNAFGTNVIQMERFPEYLALHKKLEGASGGRRDLYSEQEMREIKFWFYLAHFDPDFLLGPVALPDGSVCNLSRYVEFRPDRKFYLRHAPTEADCRRMVLEAYKVMAAVVPVHRALRFDPARGKGQIDVITTPYYHPILPLIYDSDLAHECQPNDPLPPRYAYPKDAEAQVAKAVKFYTEVFGTAPTGMWPGEGSVAQPVLPILRKYGILWTASDVKVLTRSTPPNMPNTTPYRFPAGERGETDTTRSMALVFRDTELSDRIGFKYQNYKGEEAAEDFVQTILARAPGQNDPDVLVTVILDGENAWEWYRQDMDGKEFLNALYRKLTALFAQKRIVTVTTSEYLAGNARRNVAAHPVRALPAMQRVWPGSWINANYDTWIGEPEENTAWSYLLKTRQDLASAGLKQPDPMAPAPKNGTQAWLAWKAWEEMYAAEGSDWFWWYGDDQTAPGGDKPFDTAFLTHLKNVYTFADRAGASIPWPNFAPIIADGSPASSSANSGGVMAQSKEMQTVRFECNASAERVSDAIYIAGNLPALGNWQPNTVAMHDDGRNGDRKAGDGIWTLQIDVPAGTHILYKYTNSGRKGSWTPGEEFASRNRSLIVSGNTGVPVAVEDTFGK